MSCPTCRSAGGQSAGGQSAGGRRRGEALKRDALACCDGCECDARQREAIRARAPQAGAGRRCGPGRPASVSAVHQQSGEERATAALSCGPQAMRVLTPGATPFVPLGRSAVTSERLHCPLCRLSRGNPSSSESPSSESPPQSDSADPSATYPVLPASWGAGVPPRL